MKIEYDDEQFFQQYAQMERSREGLAGAGEWHQLKKLFPDVRGKCVLDLGCGYGWHCRYAADQGADQVLGIDISARMIGEAENRNQGDRITYRVCGLEVWPVDDYFYPGERRTHFLGCEVIKQHHTITQILNGLLQTGFEIKAVEEAYPSEEMRVIPEMKDEMRRPMMLLVKARKTE